MTTVQKSVVVVDDDASINKAVKRLLLAAGFNTETFSSAEALLDEAGAVERAGCLVLDIRLPGMSGFELYQKLTDAGTQPPVIFMTSHEEGGARQTAEKAMAVAFLPKPFPGTTLVAAVTEALSFGSKSVRTTG